VATGVTRRSTPDMALYHRLMQSQTPTGGYSIRDLVCPRRHRLPAEWGRGAGGGGRRGAAAAAAAGGSPSAFKEVGEDESDDEEEEGDDDEEEEEGEEPMGLTLADEEAGGEPCSLDEYETEGEEEEEEGEEEEGPVARSKRRQPLQLVRGAGGGRQQHGAGRQRPAEVISLVESSDADAAGSDAEEEEEGAGAPGEQDNEDECAMCGEVGELLLCDGCPRSFHLGCVGLRRAPVGDWWCVYCVSEREQGGGGGDRCGAKGGGGRRRQVLIDEDSE